MDLPHGRGTCSASQIVLGKATFGYDFGTVGTVSVHLAQTLRNVGGDCVLHLPAVVGVASSAGDFRAVNALDAGTYLGARGYSDKMSAQIRSGRSIDVSIGDWWWVGFRLENGSPFPAPPCADPVSDVTRIEFPLAAGTLQIDLPTVLKLVCSSPPSMSLMIESV